MRQFSLSFRGVFYGMLFILSLMALLVFCYGCASKSIKFQSIDDKGNPVSVEANIVYFCTDQKTNDFSAVAPGGLKIKFAGQESNAKTEVALEFFKFLNGLPQ